MYKNISLNVSDVREQYTGCIYRGYIRNVIKNRNQYHKPYQLVSQTRW